MPSSRRPARRLGWLKLRAGDELVAVRKAMGLKPGEKVHRLANLSVIAVRREPLGAIYDEDVVREGFPHMTTDEFIEFFCRSHKGCTPDTIITRIAFERIER